MSIGENCAVKNRKENVRRRALRHVINTDIRWDGVVSRFAKDVGKPQSQIADMLDGRKSFGEKVARALEVAARLPPGALDIDLGDLHAVLEHARSASSDLSAAAAELGREWERLREPLRGQIALVIQTLVGEQAREERKPRRAAKRNGDEQQPIQ